MSMTTIVGLAMAAVILLVVIIDYLVDEMAGRLADPEEPGEFGGDSAPVPPQAAKKPEEGGPGS